MSCDELLKNICREGDIEVEPKVKNKKSTEKKYTTKTIVKRLSDAIIESDDIKFEEYFNYSKEDLDLWRNEGKQLNKNIICYGSDYMYELYKNSDEVLKKEYKISIDKCVMDSIKNEYKNEDKFINRLDRIFPHIKIDTDLLEYLYNNLSDKDLYIDKYVKNGFDFTKNFKNEYLSAYYSGFTYKSTFGNHNITKIFHDLYEKKDKSNLEKLLKKTKKIILPSKIIEDNNKEYLELYQKYNADIDYVNILLEAVYLGQAKTVEYCIKEKNIDVNIDEISIAILRTLYHRYNITENTERLLNIFIENGLNKENIFSFLIEDSYCDEKSKVVILKRLLETGYNIKELINTKANLVSILNDIRFDKKEKIEYIELLIDSGINTEGISDEIFKNKVKESHSRYEEVQLCKIFIGKLNKDINIFNKRMRGEFLLASIECSDLEIYKLIKDKDLIKENRNKYYEAAEENIKRYNKENAKQLYGNDYAKYYLASKAIFEEIVGDNDRQEENNVLLLEMQKTLEDSIKHKDVRKVEEILNEADLASAKNKEGESFFEQILMEIKHESINRKVKYITSFEMFKSFVKHGAMKKLNLKDYKKAPLNYTIYKNHVEVAKIMLENGANPNEKKGKQTILEENINNITTEMIELFMDFGLKLPNGKKSGIVLNNVFENSKINDEVVKQFINPNSVKFLQEEESISIGLYSRSSEILKLLLDNGLKPNEELKESILHHGTFEIIKVLCESISQKEVRELKIKYQIRNLDINTLKYLNLIGYKFKSEQLKYIFEVYSTDKNKDIDDLFNVLSFMLANGSSLSKSKNISMNYIFRNFNDKDLEKIKKLISFMIDNGWKSSISSSTLVYTFSRGNLELAKYLMSDFGIVINEDEAAEIVSYIIAYNNKNLSVLKYIKESFEITISSKKVDLNSIRYNKEDEVIKNLLIHTDDYKPANLSAIIKNYIKEEDVDIIEKLINKEYINKRNVSSYLNYAMENNIEIIIPILLELKGRETNKKDKNFEL